MERRRRTVPFFLLELDGVLDDAGEGGLDVDVLLGACLEVGDVLGLGRARNDIR